MRPTLIQEWELWQPLALLLWEPPLLQPLALWEPTLIQEWELLQLLALHEPTHVEDELFQLLHQL